MTAVLLLAHGTPDSLAEMPEYLTRVRGGRPPGPELLEEMRRNYAAIGGRSPLTDLTRAQAEALRAELGGDARVYVGMRNWRPLIADALVQARGDGVEQLVAVPMAPQYSALSVGKYKEAVERATPPGLTVRVVDSWHDHAGLVAAFAEQVEEALARNPGATVLFTAHSLPVRAIREGAPRVLVAPIGFVCDHTEILFDIDVAATQAARQRGIALSRTASLNTSPAFIRALAAVVRSAGG